MGRCPPESYSGPVDSADPNLNPDDDRPDGRAGEDTDGGAVRYDGSGKDADLESGGAYHRTRSGSSAAQESAASQRHRLAVSASVAGYEVAVHGENPPENDRPNLDRMLDDINAGRIDRVLTSEAPNEPDEQP